MKQSERNRQILACWHAGLAGSSGGCLTKPAGCCFTNPSTTIIITTADPLEVCCVLKRWLLLHGTAPGSSRHQCSSSTTPAKVSAEAGKGCDGRLEDERLQNNQYKASSNPTRVAPGPKHTGQRSTGSFPPAQARTEQGSPQQSISGCFNQIIMGRNTNDPLYLVT